VPETSLTYAAQAGGVTQTDYVQVQNSAGGLLQWSASVTYANGKRLLVISPTSDKTTAPFRRRSSGDSRSGTTMLPHRERGAVAGTKNVAISFMITAATIHLRRSRAL